MLRIHNKYRKLWQPENGVNAGKNEDNFIKVSNFYKINTIFEL